MPVHRFVCQTGREESGQIERSTKKITIHAMPRFAPREGGKLWEGGEKNYYCVANTSEWGGPPDRKSRPHVVEFCLDLEASSSR